MTEILLGIGRMHMVSGGPAATSSDEAWGFKVSCVCGFGHYDSVTPMSVALNPLHPRFE